MCAPCFNLYLDLYNKFPLRAQALDKYGRKKNKHPYLFTRHFPSSPKSESQIQLVLDLLRLGLQHAFPKTAAQIGVDLTVTRYNSSESLSSVVLSVVVDFPEKVAVNETVLQVVFGIEESKGWEVLDFRGVVGKFCECGGNGMKGKGVKGSCMLREWVL
jgi:hypothetical protein